MKVMLHKNDLGHLSIYVPKKDLEEEVVEHITTAEGEVLTLANGWQLSIKDLIAEMQLPKTLNARRL